MSARPARSVLPLVLVAVLVVVGLNTWFAVSATRQLLDSEHWYAHTWQVIGEEQRVMATVTTAESAARGFVIGGHETTLAQFAQASTQLPQQIENFKQLTGDNPLQQQAIGKLQDIAMTRMKMLQTAIDARRNLGFEATQALVSSGQGTAEMSRLRSIVDTMDGEERRLLSDRSSATHIAGIRAYFAIGLAAFMDLLMMFFLARYFQRERDARLTSELTAERLKIALDQEAASAAAAARSAEEVLVLNQQLEQRVKDRTAELETTNRELEAFSYSVSHDLRAPLRTIDGFSLALQEDYAEVVDDTGRDYINRVRAGVQRMGGLIDALLQLSRITRAELVRETTNPSAIAETVAAALQEENPDRKIIFAISGSPTASADPKLVQVALENLMGNAVKFTARREQAEISFGWDEDQQAWRVRDNGAGFDMHYKDKLFNAFNRLHGDKDFKGSGIGLATVARVIRRHHGRIWADAAVDHGATFWFTLG